MEMLCMVWTANVFGICDFQINPDNLCHSQSKKFCFVNPSPADLDIACLCKQCRSRSVGF